MNWPSTLPKEFLDLFEHGVINLHCGDLPRYRGNACPNWAILNGEASVGITIHKMDEGLDSGPIILKRHIELHNTTYIGEVYDFLKNNAPQMFLDAIELLEKGFAPTPQEGEGIRCYTRRPSDGEINWHDSAEHIQRLVRASSHPFAGAYSFLDGHKVTIWRARWVDTIGHEIYAVDGQIVDIKKGEIIVSTGEGFLIIEEYESDINLNSTRQRFETGAH